MFSSQVLGHRSVDRFVSLLGAAGVLLLSLMGSTNSSTQAQEAAARAKTIDVPFTSHDGHRMYGKLTVPSSGGPHPVVIYVQTAEGATVDIRRPNGSGGTFNYFDLYREKLPPMNVAFFSYEGRGISMGDAPPRYETIDWDVYNTSSLENKIRDALTALELIRKQPGIDTSRIFLMGTSEGTLLAAETATRAPNKIKGLILYAVLSTTLRDALKYMTADGAFLAIRRFFDTDKDGRISRAEYDADPRKYRERVLKTTGFEVFDRNGDAYFTVEDMRLLRKTQLDAVDASSYEVINDWLKVTAAVSIPKDWVRDHFAHAPMWSFLSRLDIPIGLFHGDADNLTPIDGVKRLEEQAKKAGKTRMQFHYFEDLDHSLGLGTYFARGTLPAGHKAIFEYIRNQVEKK